MILFSAQVSLAQMKTIKGSVTDGSGSPLPGANVNVLGEKNGTVTDLDGSFSIKAEKGRTLVISYIGFDQQNVVVGD